MYSQIDTLKDDANDDIIVMSYIFFRVSIWSESFCSHIGISRKYRVQ